MTLDVPEGRYFDGTGMLPPMTSWAQNFEDVTLRRALRDIEGGFWVDIGANHPSHDSVTKWFSDQGWTGINVEPNPALLDLLKAQRPRDINLGVAVGDGPGRITLHVIGDTGLSTTVGSLADDHARQGHVTTGRVEVELVTLDALLDEHAAGRTVDFLKIDAEGAETDIVRTAAFDRHRPRIVLLENTGAPDWQPMLLAKGYRFVWFDALNRFYVREEDAWRGDLLARPPSLWDSIRLPVVQAGSGAAMADVALLQAELGALRASTSWRVTRPLRALSRLLRG